MMNRDVFLYHLDNELQKLFSLERYDRYSVYSTFNRATRIGFLVCKERIIVPASNYFESDLSFKILNDLKGLKEIDAIHLISSSYNLDELLEKKANQHGNNILLPQYHYNEFQNPENRIVLPGTLSKRKHSASIDIRSKWLSFICQHGIMDELYHMATDKVKATEFEDILYEVPHMLGRKAYISDYILPLLPIKKENMGMANRRINVFITKEYIASFLKEYNAACLKDIPILDSALILPENGEDGIRYISYSKIAATLKMNKYKGVEALAYIEKCSADELIKFKNSILWQNISEELSEQREETAFSLEGLRMPMAQVKTMAQAKKQDDYSNVTIGVITALSEEFAAMILMLNEVKECFFSGVGSGHRFSVGQLKSADGKIHRIAVGLCNMGNNSAAIRATNMLNHFGSIRLLFMVGIAGGIPSYQVDDKQVRLGDIVVADSITQYDFTKENPEGKEIRSNMAKPSSRATEAIMLLQAQKHLNDLHGKSEPWFSYIDQFATQSLFSKPAKETDILYDLEDRPCEHPIDRTRNEYPRVFFGKIASANNLLRNPKTRNMLKETCGALAVEMEASGIADATWESDVGYFVVRGICDYCDTHKNDLWHGYAALVAAAYTRYIIEALPYFENK